MNSPEQALSQSQFNLWPGALLIKKGDRLFTSKEYDAIFLNVDNNISMPITIQNENYSNIEIIFAKKIYHFYKRHGIKLTLLRAINSVKYIYKLHKKGNS